MAELIAAAAVVKASVPVVATSQPYQAGSAMITLPGSAQAFQDALIYARTNGYLPPSGGDT